MNPTRPRVAPALLAVAFAAACLGQAASARAQGFGPDPFRPYNSQYDPYVFGVAPGPLDAGSNVTINRQGVRDANRYREAMEELGQVNRYDRAFRDHDRERKRIYRPNAEADRNLEARREKASDLYFQYFNEKDPRKRASLFREYTQAQANIARGEGGDPNARGARRARGAGAIPPVPASRRPGAARGGGDASIPAVPDGSGDRPAAPAARRPARPSDIPPAPGGDEPSPSEILERASRPRARNAPATAPTPPRTP
ncbi:hypothetical protein [Paludisphaera sp.]|uniref:hypothetical protein n=1 Tax=Paludisphaera sp. TaxID=2017432 RepID=UPI00301CAF7B